MAKIPSDKTQLGEILENFEEDDGAIFVRSITMDDRLFGSILMEEFPHLIYDDEERKKLKFQLKLEVTAPDSKSAFKLFEKIHNDGKTEIHRLKKS